MDETFRIGRVAGVRVGAHWSLLLIAGFIGWSLAGLAFPRLAPGYPPIAYWLAALATTAVFLQSLLAHELAHCIVARRAGIPEHGIVFWVLGAASRLEGSPPSAAVELRVAAAGPAMSAALAGGFLAFSRLLVATGAGRLIGATLGWLGAMNLLVAAFNLLPAYPLDGGRVFRALLWRWHGDEARAGMTAGRCGWLFGAALVSGGILDAALRVDLAGLWLVPLGWYLCGAARTELPGRRAERAELVEQVRPAAAPCP